MDENTISRADRISKVVESFPKQEGSLLIVNDRTRALSRINGKHWNRFCVGNTPGTLWPENSYVGALIRLDLNKSAMRLILKGVNSVLSKNSPVWIVGGNDEGIKSFSKTAEGLLLDIETIEIKKRCRLLKAKSTEMANCFRDHRQDLSIQLGGGERNWVFYPGSFSKGEIDNGTQLLLESLATMKFPALKQIADFACGTGVLASLLRQLFPEALIDAIEADSWALEAAKENAPNVHHLLSDGWSKVPNDRRYRLIVSNPPIHIGKEQDYSILNRLLQGAKSRLHRKGALFIVLQGQVVLPRFVGATYRTCEVVQQNRSYKVWRVCAPNR